MKMSQFRRTTICVTLFLSLILSFALTGCNGQQTKHKHEPATQQRFSDIDKWVRMFEDPERVKWSKPAEVVKAMGLENGDVVADIGAGTGYFTRLFAMAVAPQGMAIGLDIEESMVKYMKDDAKKLGLNNYDAKVIPTDDAGLAANSVDVIFLSNTYHHISNRVDYFKAVAKGLKKDGRVVIVDFYKDSKIGPPRDHKLAKVITLKEMNEAGYRLVKTHNILEHQYFLEFRP
jgi:ubiquinone/menaquinone biosynthesis C-methylase UbiE